MFSPTHPSRTGKCLFLFGLQRTFTPFIERLCFAKSVYVLRKVHISCKVNIIRRHSKTASAATAVRVFSLSGNFKLSYQDSNLNRQNQNLQCYHYTIRHYLYGINAPKQLASYSDAKLMLFIQTTKSSSKILLQIFPCQSLAGKIYALKSCGHSGFIVIFADFYPFAEEPHSLSAFGKDEKLRNTKTLNL